VILRPTSGNNAGDGLARPAHPHPREHPQEPRPCEQRDQSEVIRIALAAGATLINIQNKQPDGINASLVKPAPVRAREMTGDWAERRESHCDKERQPHDVCFDASWRELRPKSVQVIRYE